MIFRVPEAGVSDYHRYVALTLPLLADHGAVLEHRLSSADATTEMFVISFSSSDSFEAFQNNAHMHDAAPFLYRSGVRVEILT
jgi:hypothetical protein